MPKSEVTSNGLKRDLKKKGYKPPSSIAEYVWNGFEANATCIDIVGSYHKLGDHKLGGISSFSIIDNGTGIVKATSFNPLFESEKSKPKSSKSSALSKRHGLHNHGNSLGRLTFFTFAQEATWQTVYENSDGFKYQYKIEVDSSSLVKWEQTTPQKTNESTGTSVVFTVINPDFTDVAEQDIIDHLKHEFAWYLEQQKPNGFNITINGETLDYSDTISEESSEDKKIGDYRFNFKFILWKRKLNSEYSRYYFLNSENREVFTQTTTLNNKGDGFFHSLYITSSFFDGDFNPGIYSVEESEQGEVFASDQKYQVYQKLIKLAEDYLYDKRIPFIEAASENLVNQFESKRIFPEYDNNDWGNFKRNSIHNTVKQLYQVEPKIFSSLTVDQKKIFVRFLEVILSSGHTDEVFKILGEVISLSSEDLRQLAKTLISARLTNIVKTIQLIEDRYRAINDLRKLVFKKDEFNANEPQHIQKIIESHYWIFGEQYNLVTAEEPSFQQALEGYVDILRKPNPDDEIESDIPIVDHPSKNKQMDIFMCRQNINENSVHHIVVELKHPKIRLGKHELEQVKEYMDIILSVDDFNGNNAIWEFYLVGNAFSVPKKGKNYIKREIANKQESGSHEASLAFSYENYKIYVKTWSEIFNEFDIKYKFIQERLCLERHRLIEQEEASMRTADDVVEHAESLTSSLPKAVVQSKKQKSKNQRKSTIKAN
jgi:Histidine kinase-, DNA gyrase B-, and HSP90-like ATPase